MKNDDLEYEDELMDLADELEVVTLDLVDGLYSLVDFEDAQIAMERILEIEQLMADIKRAINDVVI